VNRILSLAKAKHTDDPNQSIRNQIDKTTKQVAIRAVRSIDISFQLPKKQSAVRARKPITQ
jgi:hypothetical protein